MSRRNEVEPYLPTLKRARAEGLLLPPGAPAERRQLAALVVHVHMVRREAWREQSGMAQSQLLRMPRGAPDKVLPAAATTRRLHRIVCYLPCSSCSRHLRGRLAKPGCSACTAYVELDHYRDRRLKMAETYVPREITSRPTMYSFESALEEVIGRRVPEALRCMDLRPRLAGSAYRSAGRTKEPTFFGHRFSDAIEQGREAVDRFMLRGPIVAHETRAYAWPFVWLRWGTDFESHELVLFADAKGSLHSFVGADPTAADPSDS